MADNVNHTSWRPRPGPSRLDCVSTTAAASTGTPIPSPDVPAVRAVRAPGRRLARVVVGAVVVGPLAAAALALGVIAGAPEHVITGSALLGFASGWAMLALLSIRMTDRPQRWALVPAAGMAATGLGLLTLAPDDRVLTAAGWVWPPLLFALAIWMAGRVRRRLPARSGRWALYPVVAVMAVAAVGGMVETVALASDQRSNAMPGQSFDVGGRRLHLVCTGSGAPTVVLQSGLGGCRRRRRASPQPWVAPPGSAPTTAPARAGATTSRHPRTEFRPPPICTPCSIAPVRTVRSYSPGTRPAAAMQ